MSSKTKVLLLVSVMFMTIGSIAQRGVRIAYVDMEYILENVDEYRDATEQLETKVQRWKVDVEQKQSIVEQMKKDLMAEKVLLTPELIAEREEEIQILEREMIEYQQDRFGPQGDLVLQKRRLIQPIQDQVFNEVQKIGANKKYDFIFDKSADVVMLYSEKRHDISDLILRGIARTRKVSAPSKKASNRDRLGAFEDEDDSEVVSEALQERLDKATEAAEARKKSATDTRTEQLKLREERKKAYEERRKKLLEEREAKKQEKLKERNNDTEKDDNNGTV
ncbi:OmpH family outer membrane protein [Maribacter sp. ACAM166]|uniref:OmpH family outer membrane protein n=1 Tax=Maribacter sp. ACAM166 TaxID=2508996 RepID=UPI0010FE19FA|nr:OmpH family outer membrane protein [Maribacter sp. ACAM166]TLP82219.1 OmpH family outer membrane protein [Maribacter sp. ACAM166]